MPGRKYAIDAKRVLELHAAGRTVAQIAERLGCSTAGVRNVLRVNGIALRPRKMRTGDVLIVQRVPRNQPGKLPEGFKISETVNTHHSRFAVNATKIERKGAR